MTPHTIDSETDRSKAPRPAIALVIPNTLAALGLSGIIGRMMPHAEICSFGSFETMENSQGKMFFHYFITVPILLGHASFFIQRQHQTIVLVHGEDTRHLPQGFHTLNVLESEQELVRAFLQLADAAHNKSGVMPRPVQEAQGCAGNDGLLTPRERDVLRELVKGHTNKEIANSLGIALATVISHRRNIAEKIGVKHLAALTIYAVTHGIVKAEDI